MNDRITRYQIIAFNRRGQEFMRTSVLATNDLMVTNALRKFVQSEVFFEGDVIKIVKVEPP